MFSISAVAAALAKGPPEPMAATPLVGLDHVAVAADDVGVLGVGHQQQRFQMAQDAVGAPLLGQFDDGARQVAVVLLELGFEAGEQREGVGGGAGETGQDLVVVEAAELAGGGFQHFLAEGDLAVAGHDDLAVAADAEDGGRADLFFHYDVFPVYRRGASAAVGRKFGFFVTMRLDEHVNRWF